MKKIDPFTVLPRPRRLRPDEVDGILDRLLMARAVDPAQVPMNQPPVADSPELDLHRAILFDAVQCAVRHHDSPLRNQQHEARSALRWIESNDDSYFLSFVPICARFGLDPDWIRRLIRTQMRTARAETESEAEAA